ncbi:MAG: DUF192 domain-containing protein [Acidimicrobiia bacterium]|nr:DUF192 domain-containing protein [Acidimicrobiia bacterium]
MNTGDIQGFELTTIRLNGEDLLVAVADTGQLRAQGLMGVTSLGDVDGMIFAWQEPTTGSFWMWTVPISLDVAFFDGAGQLVDVFTMAPCVDGESSDCPRYTPRSSYMFALERQGGELIALPADSILDVDLAAFFQP